MPPKKKKAEEQKKKIVDDKTFGLKNKKKSKKVQQYVETVKKQANQKVDGQKKGKGRAGASGAASSARLAQMAARLAELELMNQPVVTKEKKMTKEEEERKRLEEEEERERIRIANLPVEDQIEEERVKLTTRTPVTFDLFKVWKAQKDEERRQKLAIERAAAVKKMSKAERTRGEGFTGRELFQANADIFVDDEEADDTRLTAQNDQSDEDNENGHEGDTEGGEDAVQPGDASLFGGEPNAEDIADQQAVGVGDESLFT